MKKAKKGKQGGGDGRKGMTKTKINHLKEKCSHVVPVLASQGCSIQEIADICEVSRAFIIKHFTNEMQVGRAKLQSELRKLALVRAKSGTGDTILKKLMDTYLPDCNPAGIEVNQNIMILDDKDKNELIDLVRVNNTFQIEHNEE